MPKVNLTSTYGYRDPITGQRKYYGPGTEVEVPQGLVDTLGLDVLPEVSEQQAQSGLTWTEPDPAPDLPDDFPGHRYLISAGHTTLAAVGELSIDDLIEIKGIGTRLAEQILQRIYDA